MFKNLNLSQTSLFFAKFGFAIKIHYLPIFPDDAAKILAVCLSKSY